MPPSTIKVEPVMYEAASEERNKAAEATSSALPNRFKGVLSEYLLIKFIFCLDLTPEIWPVNAPGHNELKRILNFP